jgi:hypothetical protein
MSALDRHRAELRRLQHFAALIGVVALVTYALPGAEKIRPWLPGEPVPLISLVLDHREVVETATGEIGYADELYAEGPDELPSWARDTGLGGEESAAAPAPAPPAAPPPSALEALAGGEAPEAKEQDLVEAPAAEPAEAPLPSAPAEAAPPSPRPEGPVAQEAPTELGSAEDAVADAAPEPASPPASSAGEPALFPGVAARAPAQPVALEVPPGALDAWFRALRRAEAGEAGVARALHWGDSTIAADGLCKTVRRRLQSRFGDGGPGFLAVHVDSRWSARPGILRNATGWRTRTVTFGGASGPYYGLAGTVSTAYGAASSVLGGKRAGDSKAKDAPRQSLYRFDIYYQAQPSGGTLLAQPEGQEALSLLTAAEAMGDRFQEILAPSGAGSISLKAQGDGPVTVYGVALETSGPGMTWETLGVAGALTRSWMRQARGHVSRQVGRRDPALVIYQIGGNELGYPVLKSGDGRGYKEIYKPAVERLKASAPNASCLVITPLDQAERDRGAIRSKPSLDRMIAVQRQTAMELGCAFWDARAAMGGRHSFGKWLSHRPPLAWSDLYHLTEEGLNIVGNTFADVMLAEYERWKASSG